jgi:MFS family permease
VARGSASPALTAPPRLLTVSFGLLCAAEVLGYSHMGLLTPAVPLFIQEHGGSAALVGWVQAAFSATSFLLRPLIGHAVDAWSARGVLGLGLLTLGASGLGYLTYHPVLLFSVRAVHGIGWAAFNTGAAVLVARMAPPARRGEALGYVAVTQNVAMALVPALALWLLGLVGFAGVFLLTAASGFLAALAVLAMPRQPSERPAPSSHGFWGGLLEPGAILPSILQVLITLSYPALSIFVPLYAVELGIPVEMLIYYFLVYGASTVAAGNLCGRWSDRVGRGWTIALGAAALGLGLILIAQASDIVGLCLTGALAGFGMSGATPTVMALAIDRTPPDRRGAALATYSMAFQVGQGAGAPLSGLLIGVVGYSSMFALMGLSTAVILVLLARYWGVAARPIANSEP